MSLRTLVSVVLLAATWGTAQAAATLYTTQASYLAAVGANLTSITFDGSPGVAVPGQSFSPDVRFFSYPATTPPDVFHVDNAITDLGGDVREANGVGWLFAGFAQPTYAFGLHYLAGDIGQVAITFDVAGCCQSLDASSATGFIGVVSDASMAVADFFGAHLPNDAGRSRIFIDDFRIDAPMIQAIPEPGTYALVLVGLAGVGWIGRRRRPR